ncbi:MAG: phage holin family protein [Bacilli bacterium]|nr:phage holin family protein [Bacilli bacterium]MCI9434306.1 phage holin family protein [Bacilli bacterium]
MKNRKLKLEYKKFNSIFDWILRMIGYALILICVSTVLGSDKSIYIDPNYFGFWGLLTAILIYILNKTIKPLIFWLTLPLTGLTLGLFYPLINVFILKIVDYILLSHFDITGGIFMSFFVAILISILNIIMDSIIFKGILGKEEK